MFDTGRFKRDTSTIADDLRRNFTQALAILSICLGLGGFVAQVVVAFLSGLISVIGIASVIIVIFGGVISLDLLRRDQVVAAGGLLLLVLLTSFFVVDVQSVLFLSAIVVLISNAILAPRWLFYAINLVVFGKYAFLFQQIIAVNGFTFTDEGSNLSIEISVLVVVTAIVRFFTVTTERTAIEAQRSSDLLRATAEVAQITAKLLDLDELFRQSTELIRDRFAYYHVQIFILDEARKYAVLRSSTGQIGQQLIQRGHRLEVGSQSVIGRVTQLGETVIARDTESNPIHARNELLSSTRSELALPILDGDNIIGALDVQSTRSDAFDPIDVQVLQIMANQLGTAIRNARLFDEQRASVQENKRLFFESETSLREIQRLNQQLTRTTWQDYVFAKPKARGVTARDGEVQAETVWTENMMEARQRQRPMRTSRQVAVPIILRGEAIGAIEVEVQDAADDDTVEMIQNVAQRLAVSLENARLYEDAQDTTLQEQRVNQIVSQYQEASDVDELLKITLAELTHALGAKEGMIRLGKPSPNGKHQSNGHSNGSGT